MVTLQWDPSQSATSYQVQVSKKPDFTDTLKLKSGVTGTSASPSGLINGTTYYWRVRAVADEGTSRFSDPWSFTVGTPVSAGGPEGMEVRDFALMECFPNPFNPQTTISYDVPTRSRVLIAIYNPLGQLIATLVNGEVARGHHQVPASGATAGLCVRPESPLHQGHSYAPHETAATVTHVEDNTALSAFD